LLPIVDPHHLTGSLTASLRYQLKHRIRQDFLLLNAKKLLAVARKYPQFKLIERVLQRLEDDQDKLRDAEVFTNTEFQDAVEREGHAPMARVLRDLAGLINMFDKTGLSPERRDELGECFRAYYRAACGTLPKGKKKRLGTRPMKLLGISHDWWLGCIGNIEARRVYRVCFRSKSRTHFKERNLGTYSLELLFALLVAILGYKARIDMCKQLMWRILRLFQLRSDPLRSYCWSVSKKQHYDYSVTAIVAKGAGLLTRGGSVIARLIGRVAYWQSGDADASTVNNPWEQGRNRKGWATEGTESYTYRPLHKQRTY
jgi:hypothetical protein